METVKKGRRPINAKAFEAIRRAGAKEVIMCRGAWKLAIPPGRNILRQKLHAEYSVSRLADGTGWVIKMAKQKA